MPSIICPYCNYKEESDPDLLRINLGEGKGHCYECDRDFYIEAIEVETAKMEGE